MKWLIATQTVLLLLFISENIRSQLKELDFDPPRTESSTIPRMDELSALILIYSELDLTFPDHERFTKSLTVNKNRNEYSLLIDTKGKTIQLEVTAIGYLPKIIEVTGLVPKKVIVLNIFEKKAAVNLNKGDFYLNTKPEGAQITIDGNPDFKKTTPHTFEGWTATGYKVSLYKENYYVLDTVMIIDKNKATSLDLKLKAKFGILDLTTDTENQLFIGGISYNHNNPIQLPEGYHTILVNRKYFKDYVDTIKIVGQYDPMIIENEVELEPFAGTIDVTSEPIGAEVYLNGNMIGNTPLNKIVNAGYYTLEVKKDDYRTETINVEILESETVTQSYELKKFGLLKLLGINETKITLNGAYKGLLVYNDEFELPPGNYTIKAELEGYDTREFSFDLNSEVKTIDVSLTETFGRFFRFTGFGNSRIANIHNGVGFSVGYFKTELSEEIMFNLTGIKSKYSASGASFQGTLNFIPFSINAGCHISFSSEELGYSNTGKDSLMDYYYFVNVGWTPFVLWELIAPSIGVAFNQAVITYGIENESKNDVSYNSFGLYYELKINTSVVTRGGLTLKAGYQDLFDKKAISSFWFIDFGIYWIL